jgi:hypothetical protein
VNSREKGKRGERDAAEAMRTAGFAGARRGVQYEGGPGSPDLRGLPFHAEVKFTNALRLYDALAQALDECGTLPAAVLHRRNGRPWVVIVQLSDFERLAKAWLGVAP